MTKTITTFFIPRWACIILFLTISIADTVAQDCTDIEVIEIDELGEVVRGDTTFKKLQFFIRNPANTDIRELYFILVGKGAVPRLGVNNHKYGSRTNEILVPINADTIIIQDGADLYCSLEIDLNLTKNRCKIGHDVNTTLHADDCSKVEIEVTIDDPAIVLDTIAWYKDGDESVVFHDGLNLDFPEPGAYKLKLTDTNGCYEEINFPVVACKRSNAGIDFTIAHCQESRMPVNLWEYLDSSVDSGQFYNDKMELLDSAYASQILFGVSNTFMYYYISKTQLLARDTAEIFVDVYAGRCRDCDFELLAPPTMRCDVDTQYIDFTILGGDGIRDTLYRATFPDGLDTILKYDEVFTYKNTLFDSPLTVQLNSVANMSCDSIMNLGTFPSCITTKCGYEILAAVDTNVCYGGNNGAIGLSITKGSGPFTVEWNTGEIDEVIQNLATGIYEAYITDGVGCIDTFTYEITGPTQPNRLNISLDETSEDSVSISIGIAQGNGVFAITAGLDMQVANFTATRGIDQVVHFEQTKDTAWVELRDVKGCMIDTVLILTPNCEMPVIQQTNLYCGLENGSITIELPDEIMLRSTITWDDMATNNSWDRTDLAMGDFKFTIDYDKCSIPGTVTMVEDVYMLPQILVHNSCDLDGLVTYYIPDSSNYINWTIDDQTYTTFSITLPANQVYTVVTESINGCVENTQVTTTEGKWLNDIGFVSPNILQASLNIDVRTYFGFGWKTNTEALCVDCYDYTSEELIQNGVYTYYVEQYPGCYADTTLSVREDNILFDMPNVITPYGIQNNFVQIFDPYKQMASIMEFNVFDRYGNLLFFKKDFMPNSEDQLNWPSSYTDLPDVIICVAKIKCTDSKEVMLTQSVLVLR